MAPPLTPDRLIAILKAEGVHVAEYPGWRNRSRDAATGKTFGPVHLVLNHHTAGSNSLKAVAETGRPDLPAPLAHIHLAKSGVATLCSAGRANHAGLMAVNAYNSFVNEAATHPAPSKASGTVDGNDVAYGIECENLGDGKDTYTRAQYDAWIRINAAFCREFDWSGNSCAGHLETSIEGKPDPKGPVEGYGPRARFTLTMNQFRDDVDERLAHPASWSPASEEDGPMAGMTKADIYDAVWVSDKVAAPADAPDAKTNTTWQPQSYLKDTNARLRALAKKVDSLSAPELSDQQIATLAAAVAANPALAERIAELVASKLAARLAQ
ncbi:N-acetylmuramoyl-L-alanine amidase [Streptomyces sp. 1222.5]|uniref:N-acetylmuramoyl-L-alanine amidase n=1 Tax=Streptomyces sp. 1222.5 TaxID=1881026 RepID=UPI003EB6B265